MDLYESVDLSFLDDLDVEPFPSLETPYVGTEERFDFFPPSPMPAEWNAMDLTVVTSKSSLADSLRKFQREKTAPPKSRAVKPPKSRAVKPPESRAVKPPESRAVKPPESRAVKPPESKAVKPPESKAVKPPESRAVKPPESKAVFLSKYKIPKLRDRKPASLPPKDRLGALKNISDFTLPKFRDRFGENDVVVLHPDPEDYRYIFRM